MEIQIIIILLSISVLFVERVYDWGLRIKKSHCFGVDIEMMENKNQKNQI